MTGTSPGKGRSDDPGRDSTPDERARRRAVVFGDVLPEATRDDRASGEAERVRAGGDDAQEEWLRANVPPHHGS